MLHWRPYRPTKAVPWDRRLVVHLHRRAAFGPTKRELERDVRSTPEEAIDRLLQADPNREGVPADFDSMSTLIGQAAVASSNAHRLQAWWIYRCVFGPHPLQEKLTLMWHNHFATSQWKVASLQKMHRQNETFRSHAFGSFRDLLKAMLRDPALLVWLDAPVNRKGNPNENLARELLELFTLGIGAYTEEDVKQAALALTGVTIRNGDYYFELRRHADGPKDLLGQKTPLDPEGLADRLLVHPATSRRLAWRLTQEFFGEGVVEEAALEELAEYLAENNLDLGRAVATILRSQLFFSEPNVGSRVKDPLSYLIAPIRAVGAWKGPPSTLLLASWLRKMGLSLFFPPNVGGWPGGRSWMNTRSVIARSNYAVAFQAGELAIPPQPMNWNVGGLDESSLVSEWTELLWPDTDNWDVSDPGWGINERFLKVMTHPRSHMH